MACKSYKNYKAERLTTKLTDKTDEVAAKTDEVPAKIEMTGTSYLITEKEMSETLGIDWQVHRRRRSQIRHGWLPRPVRLSQSEYAWVRSEIVEWLAGRVEARSRDMKHPAKGLTDAELEKAAPEVLRAIRKAAAPRVPTTPRKMTPEEVDEMKMGMKKAG